MIGYKLSNEVLDILFVKYLKNSYCIMDYINYIKYLL